VVTPMVTCKMAAAAAVFAQVSVVGGKQRRRAGRVARSGRERTAVNVVIAYMSRRTAVISHKRYLKTRQAEVNAPMPGDQIEPS
jgi:hypothetical protein